MKQKPLKKNNRGNYTTVNPECNVESAYQTYAVTQVNNLKQDRKDHDLAEWNVDEARDFSIVNEK